VSFSSGGRDEKDIDAVLLRHRGDLRGIHFDGRDEPVGSGRISDGPEVPVAEGTRVAVAEDQDCVQAAVDVTAEELREEVGVPLVLRRDGLVGVEEGVGVAASPP
jgi:hypothetical protein